MPGHTTSCPPPTSSASWQEAASSWPRSLWGSRISSFPQQSCSGLWPLASSELRPTLRASQRRLEEQPAAQGGRGAGGGWRQAQKWGPGGTCVWGHPSASPAPGILGAGPGADEASVLGVWGLVRVGFWCQPQGALSGWTLESFEWGRQMFGAVRGARTWLDLGPGHRDPRGATQDCGAHWASSSLGTQRGDRVATAVSVGCNLGIWNQAL